MKLSFAILAAILSAASFGSTITYSTPATQNGSTYTVSVSGFSTTGSDMTGILISAYLNGSSTASTCTWAAGSTAGCTTASGIGIGFPGGTSTDPAAGGAGAIWTITNNAGAGNDLTKIVIDAVVGNTEFDLCTYGGSNTVDLTDNSHGETGDCSGGTASAGTAGSNVGYSAKGASGGSAITGTATYSDLLHLSTQTVGTAVGDIWGELTLAFPGSGGGAFVNHDTFEFYADTDTLTTTATDQSSVPEPASFGLIGLGLIAISSLQARLRRMKL
jgi:hypothetical protein